MKKRIYLPLIISVFACAGVLLLSAKANAEGFFGCPDAICGNTDNKNIAGIVEAVIQTMCYILGAVSVLVIIIAGLTYMTSAGDSAKITKAKNMIIYAVIGVVVAVSAYAIVGFVVSRLEGTSTGSSSGSDDDSDSNFVQGQWGNYEGNSSSGSTNSGDTTSDSSGKENKNVPSVTNLTIPIGDSLNGIEVNKEHNYMFGIPVSYGDDVKAAQAGVLKKCDQNACFKIVSSSGLEFAYLGVSTMIDAVLDKYEGKQVSQGTVLGQAKNNGVVEVIIYENGGYVTGIDKFKSYFAN